MGSFNTVLVPCPDCGTEESVQSKGGDCSLKTRMLRSADNADVAYIEDQKFTCSGCGIVFQIRTRLQAWTEHAKFEEY